MISAQLPVALCVIMFALSTFALFITTLSPLEMERKYFTHALIVFILVCTASILLFIDAHNAVKTKEFFPIIHGEQFDSYVEGARVHNLTQITGHKKLNSFYKEHRTGFFYWGHTNKWEVE